MEEEKDWQQVRFSSVVYSRLNFLGGLIWSEKSNLPGRHPCPLLSLVSLQGLPQKYLIAWNETALKMCYINPFIHMENFC